MEGMRNEHVPDEVYQIARKYFSEKELVNRTLAIVAINGWNRPAIGFRAVAGTYQPVAQANTVARRQEKRGQAGGR